MARICNFMNILLMFKEFHQLPPFFFNMAAWHGHFELFELAVLNGQDINPGNHIGKTPLHFAAKNGHIEVCEFTHFTIFRQKIGGK